MGPYAIQQMYLQGGTRGEDDYGKTQNHMVTKAEMRGMWLCDRDREVPPGASKRQGGI